jgi:hypothetical protein
MKTLYYLGESTIFFFFWMGLRLNSQLLELPQQEAHHQSILLWLFFGDGDL